MPRCEAAVSPGRWAECSGSACSFHAGPSCTGTPAAPDSRQEDQYSAGLDTDAPKLHTDAFLGFGRTRWPARYGRPQSVPWTAFAALPLEPHSDRLDTWGAVYRLPLDPTLFEQFLRACPAFAKHSAAPEQRYKQQLGRNLSWGPSSSCLGEAKGLEATPPMGTSPGVGDAREGESNSFKPAAGIPVDSGRRERRHPQGCRRPRRQDLRTIHAFGSPWCSLRGRRWVYAACRVDHLPGVP